jgi:hypothetical protein
VKQQRNRRIIRSDGGQKQIAETRTTDAKSVPNLKADLDRWPTRVECRKNETSILGCRHRNRATGSGMAELRDCADWSGCQRGSLLKPIGRLLPTGCDPAVISYTATVADLTRI